MNLQCTALYTVVIVTAFPVQTGKKSFGAAPGEGKDQVEIYSEEPGPEVVAKSAKEFDQSLITQIDW